MVPSSYNNKARAIATYRDRDDRIVIEHPRSAGYANVWKRADTIIS